MEETIRSYTVSTYGDAVNRLIRGKIPNIWVRGTLMQVRPSGRAVYMKLAEFEGDSPNPKATLDLIAWQGKFESLCRKAAEAPVPFELRADVQVCVLLEADFYVPHGKFQPHVLDIDENYTMGEMERVRREILARLAAEGLLDAQRSLLKLEEALTISRGKITTDLIALYKALGGGVALD